MASRFVPLPDASTPMRTRRDYRAGSWHPALPPPGPAGVVRGYGSVNPEPGSLVRR